MPGIGIGLSPPLLGRGVVSPMQNAAMWLDAELGKTGNPVSQWDDQTSNGNNATQATVADQPTDNNTFLTFDGTDHMNVADSESIKPLDSITLYSKFSTVSPTNFMGTIDKYVGGTSGYALYIAGSKPTIAVKLSKTETALMGTTSLDDGVVREVFGTVECTRKFYGKQLGWDGELPDLLKVGSDYICYYDKWDGATFNVHRRVASTPEGLISAPEENVLANHIYARVTKVGATYRMYVNPSNLGVNDLTVLQLYTSADGLAFSYVTDALTVGGGGSIDELYVDNASEFVKDGVYHLFYEAHNISDICVIGRATSPDGITFTKQGAVISFDSGSANNINYTGVLDPSKIIEYSAGNYLMFVTVFNASVNKQQLQYYTSSTLTSWTAFADGPICFFTGESFEDGIYGPNEFSFLPAEGGEFVGFYRCDNVTAASCKIAMVKFTELVSGLPDAGAESITTRMYVDNSLENESTQIPLHSIDFIKHNTLDLKSGGDGVSTNYFIGNIYGIRIYSTAKTSIP